MRPGRIGSSAADRASGRQARFLTGEVSCISAFLPFFLSRWAKHQEPGASGSIFKKDLGSETGSCCDDHMGADGKLVPADQRLSRWTHVARVPDNFGANSKRVDTRLLVVYRVSCCSLLCYFMHVDQSRLVQASPGNLSCRPDSDRPRSRSLCRVETGSFRSVSGSTSKRHSLI